MTPYSSDPNHNIFTANNIFGILADKACLHPDKVYCYIQNNTITYKQLRDESIQLAQQLHCYFDFCQNPTLAVSTQNGEVILRLTWACLAAGICLAFLPNSHDLEQTKSLMAQIGANILVTDIPELQTESWVLSYEALQQDKLNEPIPLTAARLETPAFIFQTSGTTGTAKWVRVNHRQFIEPIASMKSMGSLDHATNQVVYITSPLSHSYGLSTLLEYSTGGSSIILPLSHTGIAPITHLISSPTVDIITAIEGVPHFYTQVVRLIKRINLPKLNHIGLGGGRLNYTVVKDIMEVYPQLSYSVRYGLTETPSVVSHKLFTPPYSNDWNSSGQILPIYDLKIIDKWGHPVPAGQEGEVQIAGSSLAWPYYGETAVNEHFVTGDIGYINPDNQELYIIGRKSLFLKVRGYRISPEYIESIINTCEGVLECRVSGTENSISAELLCEDKPVLQQTLLTFLAKKLPSYAMPETITYVKKIPKTPSGKIKRH